MTTTKRGGYLRNTRNTDKIAGIAAKAWDAGLVEVINGTDADGDPVSFTLTH